ncbi:MAG: aldehyde dehydrogenase family protein [Candidatus Eremiobacterota bacterium]
MLASMRSVTTRFLLPNTASGAAPAPPGETFASTGQDPALAAMARLRVAAQTRPASLEDASMAGLFPAALPAEVAPDPEANRAGYLVDGQILHTAESTPIYSRVAVREGGELKPVLLGYEPQLTEKEALEAVKSADKAYARGNGAWPSATPEQRIQAVEAFAGFLEGKADEVARLLELEIGKPQPAARKEVTRSIEYLKATVAEYRKMLEEDRKPQEGRDGSNVHFARTVRRPLGKVLCVAPFNYPINEFLTTVVPALLMGNVVIAKTPRFGVLANSVLFQGFASCFPPGTVSALPGSGRVLLPAIMAAKERDGADVKGSIDCLAFIGSEKAANAIRAHHPSPNTLHQVLGLGAKNPAIVLEGADLATTARALARGALGFNGQRCTAEKQIYVPRAQAEEFLAHLSREVQAMKVGMPWEEGVQITPLPEEEKLKWMRDYIDDAVSKGARVVNPGGGQGTFSIMRPAILYPVTPEMKLFHEEQFGPLVSVVPYDDVKQVLDWEAASPFGQQAGVWGPPDRAEAVADAMSRRVSRVNINDNCQRGPDTFTFMAVDKSGFGALSIRDALETLSNRTLIESRNPAHLGSFD